MSSGMKPVYLAALAALAILCGGACVPGPGGTTRGAAPADGKKAIVVSYSVLGSLVSELVGGAATVKVLVPNGLDVHEWEPSARDVEAITRADLVVVNGLGLEAGLAKALDAARAAGRPFFVATDHVEVRIVGQGEGLPGEDPDQAAGAKDPHLWTDPLAMRDVALALAPALRGSLGLDVSRRAEALAGELEALDAEIKGEVALVPAERRVLVTGHESLGYFARRYGFTLAGALVPGLSSEAETSASWLADLKGLMARHKVRAIFTEVGTPPQVARAMAAETGATAIPLATHLLPETGGYAAFERELARTIVEALK